MNELICADCGHVEFDHMFYSENCIHGTNGHSPEDEQCDCQRFVQKEQTK